MKEMNHNLNQIMCNGFNLLGHATNSNKKVLEEFFALDRMVKSAVPNVFMAEQFERTVSVNVALFFSWLMDNGQTRLPEVLSQLAYAMFIYSYQDKYTKTHKILADLTKTQLKQFTSLVEFCVSEKDWEKGINPYAGCQLFFLFLKEIGYNLKNYDKLLDFLEQEKALDTKKPYEYIGTPIYAQN